MITPAEKFDFQKQEFLPKLHSQSYVMTEKLQKRSASGLTQSHELHCDDGGKNSFPIKTTLWLWNIFIHYRMTATNGFMLLQINGKIRIALSSVQS